MTKLTFILTYTGTIVAVAVLIYLISLRRVKRKN